MSDTNPDAPPSLTYDDRLKALEFEMFTTEQTEAHMAEAIFKRELPAAALTIAHLARHASNERVRFTASQYVVERNLGRVQDNPPIRTGDPLDAMLEDLMQQTKANQENDPTGLLVSHTSLPVESAEGPDQEGDKNGAEQN